MPETKRWTHPRQPTTALSRRDLCKLFSLAALSWATPALAAIDFDSMFADHDDPEPWRASYLMLCICAVVYGDSEERSKRWERLGLTEFGSESSKTTGAYAVAVGTDEHLFLAFRGTGNWKDMLADASLLKTESAFGDFKIHSGFAAQGLAMREFAKRVAAQLEGRKLWVVGHSLGGALAALLAYDLEVNRGVSVAGVVTCGAPKVGNEKWQDAYNEALKEQTWRWINQHDPIPHLPKGSNWSHVGHKNVIRDARVSFDAGDTPDAGDPSDHLTAAYLHGVRKNMPDSRKAGLPRVEDIAV